MGEPQVTAELVVRNGKKRGARLPVPQPVAVIGAGESADVRVTGTGIAEQHCVIAVTPAGPVLRAFYPDLTSVNGTPTGGGPLRDGDEIQVGPCLFQLSWPAAEGMPLAAADGSDAVRVSPDEFAALRAQAAAVVAQQAQLVDTEVALREKAEAVSEQGAQLAAVLDTREQQIAGLLEALASGREQLRRDREALAADIAAAKAKARRMRERIAPLHRKAKQDRKRARLLYQRFLGHMKRRWSAERQKAERDRADLERFRREVTADADRLTAERFCTDADAAARELRLREAWDLLAEGQRRLIADRQQADAAIAEREAAVEARFAEVEAREQSLADSRERVESRVSSLTDEVARLETRAARSREVLHDLEQKRAALEAGFAAATPGAGPVVFPDTVPLDRKADGGVEKLLAELHQRERDVARDRQNLAAARAELERRAAGLSDDRLVIAEQVAALSVARERWQEAERQSLAELESLARSVQARELFLATRERELSAAEKRFRQRHADLDGYRTKLDGWQASLAAHEATAAAARDRAEAELTARRKHLERWEAALGALCRKWADARRRDRDALTAELNRWADARAAFAGKLAELDRTRADLMADAARVAELALTAEQAAAELTAPASAGGRAMAARRVRVLRKGWESHFARCRRDADARLSALAAEAAAVETRHADLHRLLNVVAERRADQTAAEQAWEAERVARERQLDERAAELSVETERSRRTEEALATVRAEVERVAAALMASPDPAPLPVDHLPDGVIALRPAAVAA